MVGRRGVGVSELSGGGSRLGGSRLPDMLKYMSFISTYVLLLAVSAVAVLVLVSGLARREMQVRGDILGPGLRSELNQFLGTAVVNV
jgi:hypothetical protein